MRRIWVGAALAVAVVGGAAAGTRAWWNASAARERLVRDGLDRARRERDAGRPDLAARRLAALESDAPGSDEVVYERALCELVRGASEAAVRAFDRLPPGSTWAARAATPHAQAEMRRGRFMAAEAVLVAAPRPGQAGGQRREARDALVRLLRLEGRSAEARQIFIAGEAEWPDHVAFLRALDRLDGDPFPAEGVRIYLDRAARLAPDDDRVWLGRAHLATRLGQTDDVGRLLDACLKRRPGDPAVWRARLDWARAASRPDAALEALAHLPADPAEAEDLRAWFAVRLGDRPAEREALRRLSDLDPGRVAPLDRLAEIAVAEGDPGRAAQYRARQAEVNRLRQTYRDLLVGPEARAHAAELAGLAAALGMRFEAERWAALAGRPVRGPAGPTRDAAGRTLADLLPEHPRLAAALARAGARRVGQTPPLFVDDADRVGLRFDHENGSGGRRERLIPPVTASGGVGLVDYDGDGRLDVYCAQGGPFPPDPSPNGPSGDRLFRNKGDGTFEDVTGPSGLTAMAGGYGHGVAVGDVDNDGHPDLFVTRWRSYALYRNRGDGTFQDITAAWGLGGDRDWPTSAAFADLDGDGDLDLYVCHYFRWDEADHRRVCADPRDLSRYRCNPLDFKARPDHLFCNDGGRFRDVSGGASITAADADGRGLGVVAADLDGDGRVDLFVANDMTANFLWRNLGGMRFEEVALEAGVAGNASGGYQAGMGVACGDLDGDGLPDVAVTNFYGESTTFYRNLGGGRFADHTAAAGLADPTRCLLGFGLAALDADDDGRLDLLSANGHIHDGRPQFPWQMPAQLLQGGAGGRFADASAAAGTPFRVPHIGRGLAAGDLDNDGRVDALLVAQDEPLVYLHNRTEPAGGSVTFRLEGAPPGSNRDAVGAAVSVEAGGRRQTAWRLGGGSYLSAGDPRVRFGLAGARRVDRVEVRWPSGRRSVYEGLAPGGYRLREGERRAEPIEGFSRTTTNPTTAPPGERQDRP